MRYGNPSKKAKTVASLKGHSIEFPGKGSLTKDQLPPSDPKHPDRAPLLSADGIVFMFVPSAIRAEAASQGMLPESEIEEKDEPKVTIKPEDPDALRKAAYEAFDLLAQAGDRESFAGNGYPKAQAVEKLLGYALTNSEIKDLWGAFKIDKKDGA